jgi:hypothetical protein
MLGFLFMHRLFLLLAWCQLRSWSLNLMWVHGDLLWRDDRARRSLLQLYRQELSNWTGYRLGNERCDIFPQRKWGGEGNGGDARIESTEGKRELVVQEALLMSCFGVKGPQNNRKR